MIFWLTAPVVLATMMLDSSNTIAVTAANSSMVEGTLEYNGDSYSATCNCNEDEGNQDVESIKCYPTKVQLTLDRAGTGASYDQIVDMISNPGNYTYVRVTRSYFHSIDGRSTDAILGTPGGDAGEFILALLVYQDISGRTLTQDDVTNYFTMWLDCMDASTFYFDTDENAVAHLEKKLDISGLDIQNPKAIYQSKLLTALLDPQGEGDVHISLMLQYPDYYAIKVNVVQLFIQVFYSTLWAGNSYSDLLTLDVLVGSHNETAFVEIRTEDACNVEQVAPLVTPRDGDSDNLSVFINHIDAVSVRRAQLAQFFYEKVAREADDITADLFYKRLTHHGLNYLDVTGSLVAKGLPFYTATFV